MANIGAWDVPAGTSVKLNLKRKDWKATGAAIEHKNRPESVFITLSSWVKPKLSIVKARSSSTDDPDKLVVEVSKQFESSILSMKRNLGKYFDPKYFDTSSIIFTYDYASSLATIGKRQFIEIEINIDTVNDIDINGKPSPNQGTGKVNMFPFKDFIAPLESAVNKILMDDAFNPAKSGVDFSVSKGAK